MRRAVVVAALASLAACAGRASSPPPAVEPESPPETPVASTTSAALEQVPAAREDGRLPPNARPRHYAVTLDVDPTKERFTGQVTIDVDLPAATSHVVLHARDINVTDVSATAGSAALGGTATYRVAHGGIVPEELVLTFGEPLPAGRATLAITYDAPFGKDLAGLYRVKEGERWYAFTQLEATSARRAFPCFDEPGDKVPFDLEITTPRGMIAVANTPESSRVDADASKTRFAFAETPPLPTYLVAFAVGDFDVRDGAKDPVPIRLITVKGKAKLGDGALDATAGLVKKLGEYFALPYPFPKLDIVAVPDFAAGAMENPGLVTFREELLLLDPAHSSARARRSEALVLGHELAHIWFGDLVTMKWWNDVWLNEGFATWMEAKAVDAWRPEYAERVEAVSDALRVMDTDALTSARAVRQPVTSTGEIEEAFDGISYEKGAAVLAMIEHWIGPDVFQRGVRDYIRAHAWKNADEGDLLGALDRASGRDVTGMAGTFIDRPGVPSVSLRSTCASGKATLELAQSAWHPLGVAPKSTDAIPWRIPVCVREAGATSDQCTDLATERATLEVKATACPAWSLPNAAQAGYYRYSLSEEDVRALARNQAQLDVPSRVGFVSNLWAQVRTGDLSVDVALDVLPAFDRETDGHVVRQVIEALTEIDHALIDEKTRPAFRRYVAARLMAQKRRLGWQAKANEDYDSAVLRPAVLATLGDLARDPATLREAEGVAASWLKDPVAVDGDVAPIALRLASIHAGPERLGELRAAARSAKTPLDRITALGAMASFDDRATLTRAFDLMLTDEVKMQDMVHILRRARERTEDARLLYAWLQAHWDAVRAKVPAAYGAALAGVLGTTCSAEERDAEVAFFAPRVKELEGAERAFAEDVEASTACSALRAHGSEAAAAFFAHAKK